MEHPSEHTIELYVLGAPLGIPERWQVEDHLGGCEGCRELLESVSSYYADLQVDILTHPYTRSGASVNLPVRSRRAPAIFEPPFRDVPLSQVRSASALRRFVRLHPYVAGGGGLALLGSLAFLMLTFNLMPRRDLALATAIENLAQSTIDGYNKSGERLWSHPVSFLPDYIREEAETGRTYMQIADLNGDGRNEVITSLPLAPNDREVGNVLRVLNGQGEEILKIKPGLPISCRGRVYGDDFKINGFSIGDFSGNGNKEIVVVSNHLHSPCVVSRFDDKGKRLGTYRHFGTLAIAGTKTVLNGAKQELVLFGGSDNREGEYVAVVVGLDPSGITGDGESSYSGGFGLPLSKAEDMYLWIPATQLAKAVGSHLRFASGKLLPLEGEEGFRLVALGEPDSLHTYFEYLFRSDFSAVEVKSENQTKEQFERLASRGLMHGDFYDEYMKVVAGQIRYWNGNSWQPRVTSVLH